MHHEKMARRIYCTWKSYTFYVIFENKKIMILLSSPWASEEDEEEEEEEEKVEGIGQEPPEPVPLLQAMEEACWAVGFEACQGFMRHSRRFFQRCLDQEDMACDVDEALWPDRNQRRDAQ